MARMIPFAFALIAVGFLSSQANAACSWTDLTNGTPANADAVMNNLDCLAPLASPTLTGNVAIGTVPTSNALDIAGNAGVWRFSADAGSFGRNFYKSRGTGTTNTIVQNGDQLGQLSFYGANGSSYDQSAVILASVDGTPGASNDMPSRLTFYTTPNGTASPQERLRIDNAGNVGIGNTTPLNLLDMQGTDNTAVGSGTFWNGTFKGAWIRNQSNTANTVAGIGFLNGSANNAASGIGGIEESTTLSGLAFFTGGSGRSSTVPERMRITSAGDVGIGTTNPSLGHLQLEGSGNQVLAINSTNSDDTTIRLYANSSMKWRIYNNGGNDGLTILDAGEDNGVVLYQNNNSWASASDARLKRNVRNLTVLNKLSGYRAVSFDWRSNGHHDIGVVAQELDKVFPELVHRGGSGPLKNYRLDQGGTWTVDYNKLGAVALAGVKEVNDDVTELRRLVQAQQKRQAVLETENATLSRQVSELARSVASLEQRVALRTARN